MPVKLAEHSRGLRQHGHGDICLKCRHKTRRIRDRKTRRKKAKNHGEIKINRRKINRQRQILP